MLANTWSKDASLHEHAETTLDGSTEPDEIVQGAQDTAHDTGGYLRVCITDSRGRHASAE